MSIEPGRDVEPRDVDHLEGVGRIDAGGDRRDLAVRDGHVANGADPVPGVDDVAALNSRSYFCWRRRRGRRLTGAAASVIAASADRHRGRAVPRQSHQF